MQGGGADCLDTLLLAGLAILLGGVVFVSGLDGWHRWSNHRRIQKAFAALTPVRTLGVVSS
jgi:hypothetical protein